jgi:hypothetical protein
MSGNKQTHKANPQPPVPKEIVPTVQKQAKPHVDVLADITPVIENISNSINTTPAQTVEQNTTPISTEAVIPDWLKQSTTLNTQNIPESAISPLIEDKVSEEAHIPDVHAELE